MARTFLSLGRGEGDLCFPGEGGVSVDVQLHTESRGGGSASLLTLRLSVVDSDTIEIKVLEDD